MKNESVWNAFEQYGHNVILSSHNNPPLFERWLSRLRDMETQILCDSHGEPVPDSNKYTDGSQVWGPMRWPYRAATEEASYSDPPITFLLSEHLVAIGSTGWDWKNKRSRWLGYDFDSIAGHAEGVGVSDEELERVVDRAPSWVEIIRSTRGNGRHLYILFDENDCPTTNTHTEHAALARAFLPILSASSGLDLSTSVDVCGSVLWIHHRNATRENAGYSLVRPADRLLTVADCPPHWQDHLEVITGGRNKVRVRGFDGEEQVGGDALDQMTEAHAVVKLDEDHLALLDALQDSGYTCLWVADHNLAQTHTGALKSVYDRLESAGKPLKGLFDTNSPGGDPGKPNCFMRPRQNGAWDVYRFGQGTNEHPLWGKQGGWTHIMFNAPATLQQVATAAGGYESTEKNQGYLFNDAESVRTALEMLKSPRVNLPQRALTGRLFSLRMRQDGKLVLSVNKDKSDTFADFPGWTKVGKGWEILVNEADKCSDQEKEEADAWAELDDKVRMLKCVSYEDLGSMGGAFEGWVLKDGTGRWVKHPRENVASYLQAAGYDPKNVSMTLGKAIERAWSVVNEPFQPEFPGGRVWNLGASQYVYRPIELSEGETPYHPHWDRVMNHCGQDLDPYIKTLDWCPDWGIRRGGDYLKAWVACLLRHPFLKLPYLFMYGPQNSGKSMFHESIALLVTRGVVKADRALTSASGYNGELLNAILGVIDEVDISKAGTSVYNKLKEWTTGLTLSVHAKYKQVYEARSSLHFVQMSNSRSSCPVMSGDTRITAMHVPPLIEEIPKETLVDALKREAPAFMRTLIDWTIPEAMGRLRLPIIETRSKESVMATHRNPLEAFIEERCFSVCGAAVLLSDFIDAFHETLDAIEKAEWRKSAIKAALLERGLSIGRRTNNQIYIGNLSLSPAIPDVELVMASGGRLVRKGSEDDN